MSKTYSEKLRSPEWQRKRLEVMQRDDFACQFCGDKTEELHIHHVVYLPVGQPWDYDNNYLITVCHVCHEEEEKLKVEDPMLIGMFSMSGLNRRKLYALSVELRRHLSNHKTREIKFQDLMDFLANT
jgi:hypothetical protein